MPGKPPYERPTIIDADFKRMFIKLTTSRENYVHWHKEEFGCHPDWIAFRYDNDWIKPGLNQDA
jgi:hypothetical protein